MRFVLYYQGRLPSSGNNNDKHKIRQALHPQLKRLWEIEQPLIKLSQSTEQIGEGPRITGLEKIANDFVRDGFRFVPLVTKNYSLVSHLDIIFLRREAPGELVRHGGDIDNRINTLFDSLRVADASQVTGLSPIATENPFYCLLEDDSLITGFQVRTERLLEPPTSPQNDTDVRLSIIAVVRPTMVTFKNIGFLGGWL